MYHIHLEQKSLGGIRGTNCQKESARPEDYLFAKHPVQEYMVQDGHVKHPQKFSGK